MWSRDAAGSAIDPVGRRHVRSGTASDHQTCHRGAHPAPHSACRTSTVDESRLKRRVKLDRSAWIRSAVDEYPCDLLFIHRDADTDGRATRVTEIQGWSASSAAIVASGVQIIPLVPVRMTETWLLVDEGAIRAASANPTGKVPLGLPSTKKLEALADPKTELMNVLKLASGLPPRRLKKFDASKARGRIAVSDLSGLRELEAFRIFENDVTAACAALA